MRVLGAHETAPARSRRTPVSSPSIVSDPRRSAVLAFTLLAAVLRTDVEPLPVAEQRTIVERSAALIEARYVDSVAGRRIATALRRSVDRWRTPIAPDSFAVAMTAHLRQLSGDGHLGLSYSETPIADSTGEGAFANAEADRWYGAQLNHGIERIERLADNVMLLDLRVMAPTDMAGDVVAAAMTVVAQGDALILDLRRNGGGVNAGMILAGHLLPPGSPLSGTWDRPSGRHVHAVSPDWVPGRRFGDRKPVFILVSRATFSAAEALAYDLQALERATIVGEPTGGGAHPFEYRRVHAHFALELPEGRSINPITKGDWEGVGVQPDVRVPAAAALDTALALARRAIAQRRR